LIVSAPNGNLLEQQLPLGGFGISRYQLDHLLSEIAIGAGVQLYENCRVEDVLFKDGHFIVKTTAGEFESFVCCGSFGKRSNLDIKWKRLFTLRRKSKLSNYVGIKYHVAADFPGDSIALHNFKNGYCGISKVEGNKYCLCYLTNAAALKGCDNSIEFLEQEVLHKNTHLHKIFTTATMLFEKPLTISQISFNRKSQVENHVLMLGDAAGMITPLCGNGMSMALHAAKIASGHISSFLDGKTDRQQMEQQYSGEWKRHFAKRLFVGRIIQRFFGQTWLTNLFIVVMKRLPGFTRWLIRQTHGEVF
jgi:menaquinone-9 beta-reductase